MPRLAYLLCRPTVKVILFSVFLVLCFVFWSGCNLLLPIHEATTKRLAPSATECEKYLPKATQEPAAATEEVEPITCPKNEHYGDLEVRVNGEKKVGGLRETTTNKDYVPFSFVKDYFEIFGEPTIEKGKNVLIWRHTTSEIRKPSAKYNPTGPFLWFDHYRVEGRMRVKCISGIESVPVSIQWDPEGYFYPIQIAQYGLSHYSMFLLEDKSNRGEKLFDDGETPADETWLFRKETIQVENVFDEEISSRVISFSSNDIHGDGASLHMDSTTRDFILSFDLKLAGDVHIVVTIETDNKDVYSVHYVTNSNMLKAFKKTIVYGIGRWNGWRHIARDLDTDLRKGLPFLDAYKGKKKIKVMLTEIQSMFLKGKGFIDNVKLRHAAHTEFFMAAADWFMRNQDKNGGWPIMVTRKIIPGVDLKPGWYSAMAQGHGISLLVRAFHHTKNASYYDAAARATQLYKIKSRDKGVQANFFGKFVWYEEYPSVPSLFVLNGFIYSLLGLYDLALLSPLGEKSEANTLFVDGMRSLKVILPMFDAGSGTFYDLRHITMKESPNIARSDYHTLHVSLLNVLSTIDSNPIFKDTAERWTGYAKGKRAKHN